jgi:hypothetical protein
LGEIIAQGGFMKKLFKMVPLIPETAKDVALVMLYDKFSKGDWNIGLDLRAAVGKAAFKVEPGDPLLGMYIRYLPYVVSKKHKFYMFQPTSKMSDRLKAEDHEYDG